MAKETQGFSNYQEALDLYRITDKDIKAVRGYAKEVNGTMEAFIDDFYEWMPNVPEYKELFSRTGLVEQVKQKQIEYWKEFFSCTLNNGYFESRLKIGGTHANINLPISSYVAGMSFAADWWINNINKKKSANKDSTYLIGALNKLISLDIAIVSASYTQSSNDLIESQSRALMELSTPTIQLWDGILVLPILGVLDSRRTQDMTEIMLNKIQQTNATAIIVDITGVPTVDSSVANHLIKITKATKLMGCECVLSGIGPEIAQTLVHLGINLDTVETASNLNTALQVSLHKAGYQIIANGQAKGT